MGVPDKQTALMVNILSYLLCARGETGKHRRLKISGLRVLRVRVPPGALIKLSRKFGIFLINLSLGAQFYIIILCAKRLKNNGKSHYRCCFYIGIMDWIKAIRVNMGGWFWTLWSLRMGTYKKNHCGRSSIGRALQRLDGEVRFKSSARSLYWLFINFIL